jgi:hypothetical protein
VLDRRALTHPLPGVDPVAAAGARREAPYGAGNNIIEGSPRSTNETLQFNSQATAKILTDYENTWCAFLTQGRVAIGEVESQYDRVVASGRLGIQGHENGAPRATRYLQRGPPHTDGITDRARVRENFVEPSSL